MLIPNYTGSETEPHKITPKRKPIVIIIVMLFITILLITKGSVVEKTEPDSGESIRLKRYKENKPQRSTPQWKDYCRLKQKLEQITDPFCFCDCSNTGHKTGNINWFNPPDDGNLGKDWELIPEVFTHGESKHYRHKPTGEIVRYDPGHIGRPKHHYHRLNPLIKELIDRRRFKDEKDLYLDLCGKPLPKLTEENHIYVTKTKIDYGDDCEENFNIVDDFK